MIAQTYKRCGTALLLAGFAGMMLPVLAAPPRFQDITGPAANSHLNPTSSTAESSSADVDSLPNQPPTVTSPKKTTAEPTSSKNSRSATENKLVRKPDDSLVPTQSLMKTAPAILQQADTHLYAPGYRGVWGVQGNRVLCSLQQVIPDYGLVEFRQGVGQPLVFALLVDHPPAGLGKANLRIEPPIWSHYREPLDLGLVELEQDEQALTVSSEWAQRLLIELSDGLQPTLLYFNPADAQTNIKISLSALDFKTGLSKFDSCRAQLLRYDFDQVKVAVLSFSPDSSRLPKSAYQQLDEITEILDSDADIGIVDIEIYSQTKELVQYNSRLATRRAQTVRDYLLQKGINEELLRITIHTKKQSRLEKLGIKPDQIQIVLRRSGKKKS